MPYCAASLWMAASYSSIEMISVAAGAAANAVRGIHRQRPAINRVKKKALIVPLLFSWNTPIRCCGLSPQKRGCFAPAPWKRWLPLFLSFLPEILDTCGNDQNYHNGLQNATQSTYYHHKHICTSFPARQHISHWPLSMWGFFFIV